MAAARQRHIAVPSSNSPPINEWCHPFWYVLRAAALQASPKLTDAQAALLIAHFESYKVVTPCVECSTNYATDWETFPFTAAEARSADAAMRWVEDLRLRIEARRKPLVAKALVVAAVPPPRAAVPPRAAPPARRAPAARAVAAPAAPRAVAARPLPAARALPPRALSSSGDARQRQLAIRSAMQETSANRAGPRGCNCGRR
jgi:hypothetical protein